MRVNSREKQSVMFLDETWANAHDGHSKTWVETDKPIGSTKGGIRKPSGKGN